MNTVCSHLKFIRQPLQKENPEYELLELRGIHLVAKDIASFLKEVFELG